MAQLKMYWLAGTPIADLALPEEYKISRYNGTAEDREAWVACCKNGLVGDEPFEEIFEDRITNHDFTNPDTDTYFIDFEGEHIGTITAVHHTDVNCGEVHMVGIKTEFRGKGLGKYLNNVAIKDLAERGVDYIYLTTDEWRKGAVKSYLSSGFKPVEYDEGMQKRWEAVITEYDIDSIDMVNEDCSFYKTICKAPKIKIGVVGAGRGKTMINYCVHSHNAELVAVCDNHKPTLDFAEKSYGDGKIVFYDDLEEFLKHDMDAVVLANFATEHTPLAIRCMESGLDVISEVLPVQTMKEAVELIETVERTGRVYAYAENYCYMGAPKKMRELYRSGVLGEFEYGEGEYMHNCESIWHDITRGLPEHWRNNMHACYYCTHSIGPLIHITGLRPVKVTGFEVALNARMTRMGAKAGPIGMEVITLENGAVLKSIHGVGCSKDSIWYSIYGSKGRMESYREDHDRQGMNKLYVNCDVNDGDNDSHAVDTSTEDSLSKLAEKAGHGGSDFYTMYNFVEKLRGREDMDVIDVYEAMDMFLPGMFAYYSVLEGGKSMDIPNLRDPEERAKWKDDTRCTDPNVAGDMLIPSYSKGNPDFPDSTYERIKKMYEDKLEAEKNKDK